MVMGPVLAIDDVRQRVCRVIVRACRVLAAMPKGFLLDQRLRATTVFRVDDVSP